MTAFDDAWNSLSVAIGNTLTARNALDPVAQHDEWHALDDSLTQLENRRDVLAEAAITQALSTLADAKMLAKLKAITQKINKAAQKIKAAEDKVAAVTRVVSAVSSLIAFVLQLVAAT